MKKLIVGITAPESVILIEGQLQYFKELDYETYLLAPNHERVANFCEKEGCIHLPIDIEREIALGKDIRSLRSIYTHLKQVQPDIVNFGTPKVSLLGLFAARLLRIKTRIYTCRGYRFEHESGLKRTILKFFEKFTASCSHKIICISPSVKSFGIQNNLFSDKKASVIHKGSSNGLNLERFDPSLIDNEKRKKKKRELGLHDNDFVFGFVGRLVDRKGINELYEAFNRLYSANDKLKLVIVGPIEMEQIADKTLIDKMNSHKGIIMTGRQLDVPLYLSLMDVFVLPAWWEGFGNVLIQAAAMGKPIISTDVTGCKDAVSNGFNGILVESKSVEKLTAKMLEFYNNKELRETLGKNGISWAKNFDSKLIWQGMDAFYKKE
ncbi:MAG: glycosyltransferase family 4 protein [Flavobacteriaceae bacterium]|nr:glycosyltransferase family 4 protein [Flavobacteriaceae bacterium]